MRRVLLSTPTGGTAWTSSLALCRALGARGVAVTLATLGAPLTAAQWHGLLGLAGLRVEQSTWRAEPPDAVWEDMDAAGAWLLELEARDAPDAVHLCGARHGVLPFRRAPLVVGLDCPLAWNEAVRGAPAPPARPRSTPGGSRAPPPGERAGRAARRGGRRTGARRPARRAPPVPAATPPRRPCPPRRRRGAPRATCSAPRAGRQGPAGRATGPR